MLSPRPQSPGVHFLSAPRVIRGLLRSAAPGPGDLVLDIGAGPGTITGPLAATGARVLAVERDEAFVRQLTRRFAHHPHVRVVAADARSVPLPRRDFTVVANIPFALSTPLLRRLLTAVHRPMAAADLVVEWGFAQRVAAACTLETAWWATRFELRVARRVPAACFRPAPRADAAHLVVRRRDDVDQRVLWALLDTAHRAPAHPVRRALGGLLGRGRTLHLLRLADVDADAGAPDVPVAGWLAVARAVAADRTVRLPPPPKRLTR